MSALPEGSALPGGVCLARGVSALPGPGGGESVLLGGVGRGGITACNGAVNRILDTRL